MSRRPDRSSTVVVCLPGLEAVVAEELTEMGITSRPAGAGALAAWMTDRQLYAANARLACATRILIDVGGFTARGFPDLERVHHEVDLSAHLRPGQPARLRITSHRSRLVHTGAIEERLRRLWDLGPAPGADEDGALIVVRVDRDRFRVRVDSSGAPLHHRGWRGPAGRAPLRETLAAAALRAAGWRRGDALVDPFCGSGTIVIEAARAARGIAAGADRGFAFGDWPSFAPGTWASVRAELAATEETSGGAPIVGSDRDQGAVAAAEQNAEAAGVADEVSLVRRSVSEVAAPGAERPGWVVTNPPWGGRVSGGGDLRDLYARLGQVIRAELPGWGVALLVADVRLARATGLAGEVRLVTRAGPTPVSLFVVEPRATLAPA